MNEINFTKPKINYSETNKILAKVLKSGFINQGIKTREFETKICNFLKIKYAVTTTSGTSAIFLALKAAGVKKNDEVIVPNITFPATANAVKLAGAKPMLVDVNPESLLINQKSLKKIISKKTKFIIPVHISGRGNNITNIVKICKKNSIKIIEDAAEAFGSKINRKNLGSFGVAGCFSFAPNKLITTGQGGVVVTNSKHIFQNLKILKDQGRVGKITGGDDKYVSLGFNFKFTDLQAAVGLSQIKNLNWRVKKLKKIHNFYLKNIKQNKNIKIIKFHLNKGELPLWTDIWCNYRNELYKFLKSKNIECRYYWKPLNLCPSYLTSFKKLENSKKLQGKLMWLPSSLNITNNDQKKICNLINFFYKNKNEK